MRRFAHRIVRDESGQELVEFAVASLVFFITVFGILEFGIAIWQYNMVANLAQEGARYASVRGSTSALPGDVAAFVQSRSTGITVDVVATPPGAPGETAVVTVSTTFAPLTSLIPFTTMTLQSTAQMVVAR